MLKLALATQCSSCHPEETAQGVASHSVVNEAQTGKKPALSRRKSGIELKSVNQLSLPLGLLLGFRR